MPLWLGKKRGYLVDWSTQRWVQATGRRVRLADHPWLQGPVGDSLQIGGDYYQQLASARGLELLESGPDTGLMAEFATLAGPHFDPSRVHPEIGRFYERTSNYRLDAWSQWCGVFRPFGWLLARIFSRRLQQLNVPLSPMDTSRGLSSRVVQLVDPISRQVKNTGWVREIPSRQLVVYVGDYSTTTIPGFEGGCVRVVFPLPNGSATVILRPEALDDGSLVLHSSGDRFGDPGFYFIVVRDASTAWARYLRTLRERIHVYLDENGELRTDHHFRIWGLHYLALHYRLLPDPT